MKHVLRLAIADPAESTREALKATLLGMDSVWLEAECSRYEFFPDVISQTNPEIAIVSLDHDADQALSVVTKVTAKSPDCSIVVVSASTDGNLILRAMRAGAKEFITRPIRFEDLVSALDRITHQRSGRGEGTSRSCNVVAVAGATGGVGSTSLAVNLGAILAQRAESSVVLVDLDLCLGDADVLLDTIPDYTIVDVAQNVTRLDFTLLKRSLTRHSSGLFLLPRPLQMEDASLITPDDLQRVIGLLKASFSHMVIDLSKSYSRLDMIAMSMANHVLLVTQLDLPCLRNVVRLMMSFNEVEGLADKVKIVVNRLGLDSGQISIRKAQDTIGREIFWKLPNDYLTMVEARNNGIPLVEQSPKAKITASIVQLADMLSGGTRPESALESTKSSIARLLNLWGSKAGGA